MNEKVIRKPRNVLIDPKILREARIKMLRLEKKSGEWLEEAIREKKRRLNKKTCGRRSFWDGRVSENVLGLRL